MQKNIIFIAPPAAGKGTHSEILRNKFNLAHISTGDLLREESKKENDLGRYLKEQMKTGNLISDEIVTELLEKRLQADDCNNGYILDGYPRNINQANILDNLLIKLNKQINYVFYLSVDKELAMKRACGRLGCPICGKIYNSYFEEMKPKVSNTCDKCGVELNHRDDDNEESFNKRFDTYINSTKPLLEYYESKNLLYTVDSGLGKEIASSKIINILEK